MPDETKPTDPKPSLEAPKDIEDLLKDLPKISSPKPPTSPTFQTPPPSLKPPENVTKLTPPSFKPLTPEPPKQTLQPIPQTSPPSFKTPDGIVKPQTIPPIPPSPGGQQDKFKSLIRTMGEDLESAKKGVRPESKPFEIKPPPSGPKIPSAPSPLKTPFPSEIRLGPAERTKSLDLPAKAPFTDIARVKKSSVKKLLFLVSILGIAIVFIGVWYFMTRQEKVITITPTFTPTPPPISKTLSELIPSSSQIIISSTENFLTALNNGIKSVTLTNGGWIALNIVNENGVKYSPSQVFQRLGIAIPNGLLENLNLSEWTLAVYGQQEMYDSKGVLSFNPIPKAKLGFIVKTNNPSSLRSALNNWEITMTDGLKNLLAVDPQKALSPTFLDNIYAGTEIRYRNFSYADNSIDYALLNLSEFNSNYLILTNSRESTYSAVDLLQNQ